MKKNYFFTLLLTLCIGAISFGQVTLPHYEAFNYTVSADLGDQTNWENFSGSSNPIDIVSGNLTYSGLESSTGNSINMVGGFIDSRLLFNEVTSGEVYASFLVKVTDISNITDLTDGGYFAIFGSTTNSFRSRMWVKPATNPVGSTFEFAYTNASSGSGFGNDYNVNDVVMVVMSYNVDTGVLNAWINPSSTDFEAGSAPTPDLTATDGSPTSIDRFMLRQDSTGETPNMIIDELRIGNSWASVTPKGTVSSSPELTINSPTEGSTIDYVATATVKFNVNNFNVAAGGTGDGYIKWKLDDVAQTDKTDTSDITFSTTAGSTYKVYIELVDNSGNPLSTPVNATVNFTVNHPCDLELGAISTTCDALTTGTDTYSGSIAFTGGNTGATYTITAPAGVVVGGDNPNTTASGTITFTNITEGVDAAINIAGGATSSCDFDRTLYSPVCLAFPVVETFNYTVGQNLGDQPLWTNSNSGDEILIATPTIANPFSTAQFADPTGNMVSFDGSGKDPFIEFNQQNSGTVYASFLFTATDISGLTNSNGGYFAVLTQASASYKPRLWLRQDTGDNTKYNVGITAGSSGATYHTVMHTPGEEVFVVMAYDFATNDVKVWINPDPANFGGGTVPAETLKVTASGNDIPSDLGRFLIRQDSGTETPSINFDELRISTSWADVTPKGAAASVEKNNIDGFTTYPNPVNNGRLTITTSSASEKEVTIFNVLGKRVFSQKFTGTNKQLDVSQIKSGIYIMKVIEDEKVATKKLVIK